MNQLEIEREDIVTRLYIKHGLHDKLKERWKLINYTPKKIQLKLWT